MEKYQHKISGLFGDEASATQARDRLQAAALNEFKVFVVGPDEPTLDRKIEPESSATRDAVIKDTLVGAGIGSATGLAGTAALAAASVGLVLASPVAATLLAAGYGATIGSLAGAVKGFRISENDFAAIVQDALNSNHWAVIVHTQEEEDARRAEEILQEMTSEDIVTM